MACMVLAYTLIAGSPLLLPAVQTESQGGTWTFAVSGDSRNYGDVIVPAIAEGVKRDHAAFYWHLGDFRLGSGIDEDFRLPDQARLSRENYRKLKWVDFELNQLAAFDDVPVYVAIGNHETIPPETSESVRAVFRPWLDAPVLRAQRLADDPTAAVPQNYYHWIQNGVDFITLDNSTGDQFDSDQLKWLDGVLQRAASNGDVKAIVVGMHEALPDSLSAGHSMNESTVGTESGRKVYRQLTDWRVQTGKRVYLLASHAHFLLNNIFDTACRQGKKTSILPGWIIGTAGAVRYRLPAEHSSATVAETDVYGYLLGTVQSDGEIRFAFKEIKESDVPDWVKARYANTDVVHDAFADNKSNIQHPGPAMPPNCPE
jgi:hypothetical protein